MAKQTIKTVFQFRRDTTANWEQYADIVPAAGEPCYDLDLKIFRVGDGKTAYKDLPVISSVENFDDLMLAIEQLQTQVGDTNIVEIHENYTNLTTQVEAVNTEVTEMQQALDTKADAETVSELQTVVEQKLDADAVKELETGLKTYIDEQMKTVEVTNIDDGEI
jgi:hypothetical protein